MPTLGDTFTETTSAVAREAGVTPATVRSYIRLGLLGCITASNGVVLLSRAAPSRVREIRAQRMANRFRRA